MSKQSVFLRTICEDLFVKPVFESMDDCYQQGKAALSQCYARVQNPYPIGTVQREWWDGGFCDEADELTGQ